MNDIKRKSGATRLACTVGCSICMREPRLYLRFGSCESAYVLYGCLWTLGIFSNYVNSLCLFFFSSLILRKWVYFHNNWYQSSMLVDPIEVNAFIAKVDVVNFNNTGNFRLFVEKGERLIGTGRFGESFVWFNKETRLNDLWWVGITQNEGGEYTSIMSGRWAYVWCHGWGVNYGYIVEVGDGRRCKFGWTLQHLQSSN